MCCLKKFMHCKMTNYGSKVLVDERFSCRCLLSNFTRNVAKLWFRGESQLGLRFVIKEINKLVDQRHHCFFVFFAGNIFLLEAGRAEAIEGKSVPLKYVLPQRYACDQLERTLRWGGWGHLSRLPSL